MLMTKQLRDPKGPAHKLEPAALGAAPTLPMLDSATLFCNTKMREKGPETHLEDGPFWARAVHHVFV